MKVWHEALADVARFIDNNRMVRLEDRLPDYRALTMYIGRFKILSGATRVLEVGPGTGWFPILCEKNGIPCRGLEISLQLVEYSC